MLIVLDLFTLYVAWVHSKTAEFMSFVMYTILKNVALVNCNFKILCSREGSTLLDNMLNIWDDSVPLQIRYKYRLLKCEKKRCIGGLHYTTDFRETSILNIKPDQANIQSTTYY
jgi:hypothetical protein